MIDRELLARLCCPETHQKVELAEPSLIARVNATIQAGRQRKRSGQTVREPIEGGLVREDQRLLYPIRHGIPAMLLGEGIELEAEPPEGRATRAREV